MSAKSKIESSTSPVAPTAPAPAAPATEAPAAPAQVSKPDERLPAEAWAIRKGHCARVEVPGKPGSKPTVVNVPARDWRFAAIKAHENWPEGKLLTDAEYTDAARRALSFTVR